MYNNVSDVLGRQLSTRMHPKHNNIILCIDVMFVSGVKFFLTMSRDVDFVTAAPINDKKYSTYVTRLEEVLTMYARRGFFVKAIFADPEF